METENEVRVTYTVNDDGKIKFHAFTNPDYEDHNQRFRTYESSYLNKSIYDNKEEFKKALSEYFKSMDHYNMVFLLSEHK